MTEAERCAQYIDWLMEGAETSTGEDLYRRMAIYMRSGATLDDFIEKSQKVVMPELYDDDGEEL